MKRTPTSSAFIADEHLWRAVFAEQQSFAEQQQQAEGQTPLRFYTIAWIGWVK